MAVTAESVVVELLARTDDFDRKIGRAANDFDGNMRRIENSQARVANAQRNLGFQFQDFTTQVASGGSVFTAFAQQAGQAAGALSDLGGTAGRVGTFLSGPYGSIIIAATAILGNLALAHFGAEDGAKKQEKAEKALKDAIANLDQVTGIANTSQREKIRLSKLSAEEALKEAKAKLALADAELQAAETRALAGRGRAANLGGNFVAGGLDDGSVASARRARDELAAQIARQEAQINRAATFGNAELAARAAVDPIERIRQQTAEKVDAIKALNLTQAETTARLTALYKQEEDAIAAIAAAAVKARGASASARREARAALADELQRIDGLGLSEFTAENFKRDARDRAAGLPTDFATQARRGDFDTPVATAAATFLTSAKQDVPEVVLDFEQLRDVVGDISRIPVIDADALRTGQKFAENLSQSLGQAIIFSGNIGDALVNSFKAAAAELVTSGLLNILSGGRSGTSFGDSLLGLGSLFGISGRASGGPVSAGQVVRINETGQELFQPSVPGRIIPAGMAAMQRGGGAVINQSISLNFAGNAATREDAALFARVAYEQSLAAMRQAGFVGVPTV